MIEYDETYREPKPYLSSAQLLARYPRVAALARWTACLTTGEVTSWLKAYREGHLWAGEAVNHYGGVMELAQSVARLRTNYSTRHMIGIGKLRNCTSCVPHNECACPCATCRFVMQP